MDTELECAESPCVFENSAIGELEFDTEYEVLVEPQWKKDFVVPFPLTPATSYFSPIIALPECTDQDYETLAYFLDA